MKIHLKLENHCIETEIRRQYNRCISLYFKPNADKVELEKKIEVLTRALDTLDFPTLRSMFPELAGGFKGEVAYRVDGRGRAAILINGKPVEAL